MNYPAGNSMKSALSLGSWSGSLLLRAGLLAALLSSSQSPSLGSSPDAPFVEALRLIPEDVDLVGGVSGASSADDVDSASLLEAVRMMQWGVFSVDRTGIDREGELFDQTFDLQKLQPLLRTEFVLATRGTAQTSKPAGPVRAYQSDQYWLVFRIQSDGDPLTTLAAAAKGPVTIARAEQGIRFLRDSGITPGVTLEVACASRQGAFVMVVSPCSLGLDARTADGRLIDFSRSTPFEQCSRLLPGPMHSFVIMRPGIALSRLADLMQGAEFDSRSTTPSEREAFEKALRSLPPDSIAMTASTIQDGQRVEVRAGPDPAKFQAATKDLIAASLAGKKTPAPPPAPAPKAPLTSHPEAADENGDVAVLTPDVSPPEKIVDLNPEYPIEAQAAGAQGRVILQLVVDESGDVARVKVLRSVPMLDQAAIDATKQWKYKPATKDGKPLKVFITVTVNFKLRLPSDDQQ